MTIDPRGSTLAASTTPLRIRVRGNVTSWVSIKLPYKIKTDKKASLLGMPASKNWALLANFYDRSMLRNQLAFETSRRAGLPWTPRTQHVELWVDGGYRGLYQLAENVEAEPDRVVVPEGGHLLEADSYPDDSTPSFRTPRGIQIFLKGDETAAERDVVAGQVGAFEDALYGDGFTGPDGWASHADVDSFVDWYIVNELTKNIDASLRNSVWMTIDAQGRLSMGPVWDFDFSAGNRSNWSTDQPSGWFLRTNWFDPTWPQTAPTQVNSAEAGPDGHWFVRLFDDPAFEQRVRERWNELSDDLATLPAYVRSQAELVAPAAARNFAEGSNGTGLPIGPTFLDPEPDHVFAGSWDGEVDLLATWIGARRSWIDQQLDD
nr:CotH kinase family protein [Aeromicrobium sp. CFBP 8757]